MQGQSINVIEMPKFRNNSIRIIANKITPNLNSRSNRNISCLNSNSEMIISKLEDTALIICYTCFFSGPFEWNGISKHST